jgi:hypothetical protein
MVPRNGENGARLWLFAYWKGSDTNIKEAKPDMDPEDGS